MIIWFSSPLILTRTLAHTVSLFHLFSRYHFSLRGSCCQFLPRLIIALLVSLCNGPILSNPEHWASALPMTKDYFIDSSLSLPVPSLCLTVLFLHSFMSSSNFLTLILCSFLPMGSHDLTQCKAGSLGLIHCCPLLDSFSAWLPINPLKISDFCAVGAPYHCRLLVITYSCFSIGGEVHIDTVKYRGWDNEATLFFFDTWGHYRT